MKTNQMYTTKQVRQAVLEMINHFCPSTRGQKCFPTTIYRDRRKNTIRYKVDWKPEERYIKYLQALLPGATIKPFDWKCWHPIGGSWIQPTIVITVPFYEESPEEEAAKIYSKIKDLVWKAIKQHHIDWNMGEEETCIQDLILVLSNQYSISVDAEHYVLYWSEDGVNWTNLAGTTDLVLLRGVLWDLKNEEIVDYDFE